MRWHREEVRHLTDWCTANHLQLNTTKTKEVIIDFRRNGGDYAPFYINWDCVERVTSFKFLEVYISKTLSWTTNITALIKKAQQCLHFLTVLRKSWLEQRLLVSFYQFTIQHVFTYSIMVWYAGSSAGDKKPLQRVINSAQKIIGCPLPSLQEFP